MTDANFKNEAELVKALWNEIKENGLYNSSKIDFYDFVLYLLNKYDTNHFLYKNDNEENERLLRVSSTKIKAAKKNISVKFMNKEEYNNIFVDFLKRIGSGELPSLDDTGDSYTMVIEDPALRSVIEAKLKRTTNSTVDYKLNKENVVIKHKPFVAMLASELKSDNSVATKEEIESLLNDTINSLNKNKSKQADREAIQEAVKTLKESDSIQSLGINAIKAVATFVADKIIANIKIGN